MQRLTMTGERRHWLWRSRWAAIGAAIAVSIGAGGIFIADAASTAPSNVVLVDPARILDTRNPTNLGLAGPFVSTVSQKLQVTGAVPKLGGGTQTVVPAGATGVILNVTAVNATANGFVSVRPGNATGTPTTSSLNVNAGVTVPNAVTVALPTAGSQAGKIDITWSVGVPGPPSTDILVDVVGYTLPPGGATQAHSSAAPNPAVDAIVGTRTITTSRAGHLQLSFVGRGSVVCPSAATVQAWIEIDGTAVSSSRVTTAQGTPPTSQLVLQGVTSSPVAAGDHQVRVGLACSSGNWGGSQTSSTHSWIATVLAGAPAVAALDTPAALTESLPPATCETIGDETTCTPG